MDLLDVLGRLLGVSLIVCLNGFFVAAEFAIVKVRSTQIEPLARSGSKRARIAHHVVSHLDIYLSACQLGVTMTSLALGWVGEPFVARLLMPLFELFGTTQAAVIHAVSVAVGFGILTFLHIVVGEQGPKWLVIQYPRESTLLVARPLYAFTQVFRPFIWLLNASSKRFLRLIGVPPMNDAEMAQSEEEIRLILSKGKALSTMGKTISLRAMELRERTVREVMVPRTSVTFLSVNLTVEENIAIAVENQFTRYPLCESGLDTVLGMIHLKDLFKISRQRPEGDAAARVPEPGTRLLEIKREMLFVPETTPLEKMLNTFLSKRVLMAVAVDEYGGAAGLVTLENVLEELVGEIRDEFDAESALMQPVGDGEFLVEGAMPLYEFARAFDVHPGTRHVVTVSGYVIQLLGRVPEKGAKVRIGPWQATVESLQGRIVKTLRVRKIDGKAP